jgi:hypothetical protein
MAAAAPVIYTLDANDGGDITINDDVFTELTQIQSSGKGMYKDADRNVLINDQKEVNYLDAIKDGTNVSQLDALEIYFKADKRNKPQFPADLHDYEGKLLVQNKNNLIRTTWLKTKKNSNLNLIQSHYVFWESGLGYDSFIEDQLPEAQRNLASVVTFGSYIDPLSKPGNTWPPNRGDTIIITENFMEQFGFGKSRVEAKTITPDVTNGKAFHYTMKIACGNGCTADPWCIMSHNGDVKNNDSNDFYFKGNKAKNNFVKGGGVTTADKSKLIVAKGWGDKVQVMIYYMFYCLKKRERKTAIMITCDFVVFCFCITLSIPCVYTGIYSRGGDIEHKVIDAVIPGKSYYSILHFNPGTPLQNAIQNYKNTVTRIYNENIEFIDNILDLISNFNTVIEVRNLASFKFKAEFYEILHKDMIEINKYLYGELDKMDEKKEDVIDDITLATNNLKKKYLIVPMFKFVDNGNKIIFLQTRLYTSDISIMSMPNIHIQKDNARTFFEFARGGYLQSQSGGEIQRRSERIRVIQEASKTLNNNQKNAFPERDYTPKINTLLPEHMNDTVNVGGELFTEFREDGYQRDIQNQFDNSMRLAIESLDSDEQINQAHRAGGRRRNTTRRQKGGGDVDETLFETLYTLYVYRAQYDIELDTPDQSINMKVLRELYKDYPKSMLRSNSRMTLNQLTGERMVTYPVTGGPANTRKQPANTRSPSTGSRITGMTSANRQIYRNTARPVRSYGGRITRRKKRRTRK